MRDHLFYLPSNMLGRARAPRTSLLNEYLDVFCDYVNLEPDALGRRWYVRTHEMRKWFLLLLFWSGRYDVLDAARWIAGHTDIEHIHAYIEGNRPGEELPQLEAEYAIERLRVLESTGTANDDEKGLETLYERVLGHFNASALAIIDETEWIDYVTTLREEEHLILEPHSIQGKNSQDSSSLTILFKLVEND